MRIWQVGKRYTLEEHNGGARLLIFKNEVGEVMRAHELMDVPSQNSITRQLTNEIADAIWGTLFGYTRSEKTIGSGSYDGVIVSKGITEMPMGVFVSPHAKELIDSWQKHKENQRPRHVNHMTLGVVGRIPAGSVKLAYSERNESLFLEYDKMSGRIYLTSGQDLVTRVEAAGGRYSPTDKVMQYPAKSPDYAWVIRQGTQHIEESQIGK